ncbi:hypothetical protein ACJX0J_012038, partial [Zea mays]
YYVYRYRIVLFFKLITNVILNEFLVWENWMSTKILLKDLVSLDGRIGLIA